MEVEAMAGGYHRQVRVSLLLVMLVLCAGIVGAQSYRGEANTIIHRADPVEFLRIRFLTFAFGREGPMDAPAPMPPVGDREYFVAADVFGIESAATIRFEIVDINGRSLQTITMWKQSDSSTDGEFNGFVKIPTQPFRFAVNGTNTSKQMFRSVFNTLFQPAATGPVEQVILPSGVSPDQRRQLQSLLDEYRRQLHTRAARTAVDHPDGVITLSRAIVSRISYEPLDSSSGLPIGLRLRYSIQFPARQTIVATPHVFPVYQATSWRGIVSMKALGGTIDPPPQFAGAQSLQDVILYGAAATYQPGSTYKFTIDLVPDYVLQGTQTRRFCLYEQKFTNRAVWDALIASEADVPYSLSIPDTETTATVPAFLPQRTFYKNFIAGGAFDCGPVPNLRF
jgi:hypothetical protein